MELQGAWDLFATIHTYPQGVCLPSPGRGRVGPGKGPILGHPCPGGWATDCSASPGPVMNTSPKDSRHAILLPPGRQGTDGARLTGTP